MAAQDPALLARLRRQGFGAVRPSEGLAVLASLLSLSAAPQAAAAATRLVQFAVLASPLLWPELLRASVGSRANTGFYAEFAPRLASHGQHVAPGFAAITADGSVMPAPQAALVCDSQQQEGGGRPRRPSTAVVAAVLAIVRQVLAAEVALDQGLMEVRQNLLPRAGLPKLSRAMLGKPAAVWVDHGMCSYAA